MSLEEQLVEERRHANVILEDIRHDFRAFGEGLAHQRGQIGELKDSVDKLSEDMAMVKADFAVLKTDVAVLKTDVAVLKTDVAEVKTRLQRVEHHVGLNGTRRRSGSSR